MRRSRHAGRDDGGAGPGERARRARRRGRTPTTRWSACTSRAGTAPRARRFRPRLRLERSARGTSPWWFPATPPRTPRTPGSRRSRRRRRRGTRTDSLSPTLRVLSTRHRPALLRARAASPALHVWHPRGEERHRVGAHRGFLQPAPVRRAVAHGPGGLGGGRLRLAQPPSPVRQPGEFRAASRSRAARERRAGRRDGDVDDGAESGRVGATTEPSSEIL